MALLKSAIPFLSELVDLVAQLRDLDLGAPGVKVGAPALLSFLRSDVLDAAKLDRARLVELVQSSPLDGEIREALGNRPIELVGLDEPSPLHLLRDPTTEALHRCIKPIDTRMPGFELRYDRWKVSGEQVAVLLPPVSRIPVIDRPVVEHGLLDGCQEMVKQRTLVFADGLSVRLGDPCGSLVPGRDSAQLFCESSARAAMSLGSSATVPSTATTAGWKRSWCSSRAFAWSLSISSWRFS
jgi:hypothetical protein